MPSLVEDRTFTRRGPAPAAPFQVRQRRPEDLFQVARLMARTYPPPHPAEAVWSEEALLEHIHRFPQGQILAEGPDGQILGDSTGMRVDLQTAIRPHTWREITARGHLTTHDPGGDVFYGVDIAVDPAWRGLGVASAIYAARFRTARELGCRAFVAGARIPDYHRVAHTVSPERYIMEVKAGLRTDATLSKQLHLGFRVLAVLPGYFDDHESKDFAVLIVKSLEDA